MLCQIRSPLARVIDCEYPFALGLNLHGDRTNGAPSLLEGALELGEGEVPMKRRNNAFAEPCPKPADIGESVLEVIEKGRSDNAGGRPNELERVDDKIGEIAPPSQPSTELGRQIPDRGPCIFCRQPPPSN